MQRSWQIQEAKNKLSEVVEDAIEKGPQILTRRGVDPDSIYLSVLTLGEIQKGVEKVSDLARKKVLESWLREELLVRFQDHFVTLDTDVLLQWGSLAGRLETQGTPMPAMASLLAATALHGNFVLVT